MSVEVTRAVVAQMKAQGNQPGLIQIYKLEMEAWALRNPTSSDARSVLAWLPHFHARPFYTAEELVPLFPALARVLGITRCIQPQYSAKRMLHELVFVGLPKLQNRYGDTKFRHPAYPPSKTFMADFFIVEEIHKWRDKQLLQHEFEDYWK